MSTLSLKMVPAMPGVCPNTSFNIQNFIFYEHWEEGRAHQGELENPSRWVLSSLAMRLCFFG
ncbi:hypothetical protein K7432_013383 [Basidiobolus ranarum]|uniref:Uncharacterized protein n=1 Tax=Basidiobolus ranarum TaxID=34480 RepID=A0ABR2WJB4_9FUNG